MKLLYKIANKIISFFSPKVQNRLLLPFLYVLSLFYKGDKVYCPYCQGNFSRFLPCAVSSEYAAFSRPYARCPRCGSLERYRLLYLYLKDKTDFFSKATKVLDIGPIHNFQKLCLALPHIDYTAVDLYSDLATIKMDITAMTFSDAIFDCAICYHVLEHVEDDRKAMQEIYRVLKPGGYAISQVPVANIPKTLEDRSLSEEERERFYGARDHLRLFGLDYKDRLESVGFEVKVDDFVKHLDQATVQRFGLDPAENIYFCRKK